MNKAKIKNLMVEKGERFGLIAAGALMLLFLMFGVLQLSGSPNPDKDYVQEVDKNTTSVKNTINGKVDEKSIDALPQHLISPPKEKLYSKKDWPNNLFFDPFAPPDKRAVNPIVLALEGTQADLIWAKMIAYDIREGADGLVIGVIKKTKIDKDKDNGQTQQFLNNLQNRYRTNNIMVSQPRPMGGNGPGGAPGMMPPAAPGQGKPGGKNGPGGALVDEGERVDITYIPLDSEKLQGNRPALTIYPQRMVIVQAALPYKAQIKEIQEALRLPDPSDVAGQYKDETTPFFRGFLVQRQVLSADGKTVEEPWSDLDVVSRYRSTILLRMYGDRQEDPKINYVLLHKAHRLVTPLPMLLNEHYPDIRIPEIQETIKKQLSLNTPPEAPKQPSQFNKDADIFEGVAPSPVGASGQPNLPGVNVPRNKEGDPSKAGMNQVPFNDQPAYKLVRIVDNDIVPGRVYQYRVKIRMQNPNWVGPKDSKDVAIHEDKRDKVSRPSDADVEFMDGPWTEVKDKVSVPREDFLFAIDPTPDPRNPAYSNPPLKEGQGLLQFQRWLANANVSASERRVSHEPVADWVVADIIATRGTYLGGKQFVNLPLWSSEYNRYILREVPPERGRREKRLGVLMDPTKPGPSFAVVDVEGGTRRFYPLTKSISINEDTANEVLLMDENGGLQVRSSYADRFDDDRAKREEAWKAWINKTNVDTDSLVPDNKSQQKKGFE